jgi:hypothetical protein
MQKKIYESVRRKSESLKAAVIAKPAGLKQSSVHCLSGLLRLTARNDVSCYWALS